MADAGRRVAVALSGGGRSLANLLKAAKPGGYEIAAVVASTRACGGVGIAERAGLPVFVGDFGSHEASNTTGPRLYAWLAEHKVDWIALAGFLKLFPLSPAFAGRIVNIHPALLPRFGGAGMYGDRVHRAVIAAKAKESGATVHFVTERYDEGAVIAQITVPVRADDTERVLADRVFAAECQLYPHALEGLVARRLPLPAGVIHRISAENREGLP